MPAVRVTRDGVLVVEGERKQEEEKEENGFKRFERVYGQFVRRFRLVRGPTAAPGSTWFVEVGRRLPQGNRSCKVSAQSCARDKLYAWCICLVTTAVCKVESSADRGLITARSLTTWMAPKSAPRRRTASCRLRCVHAWSYLVHFAALIAGKHAIMYSWHVLISFCVVRSEGFVAHIFGFMFLL